ncbi:lactonase family protein [uncultured Imperialibacter sp.]|uniref:lactonase family protein n=1 Tax=uncultured Imperialibacter sp. TaxID=1672639 RepID=UPI0030DBAB8D|tara:strand:+ start:11791 stop:12927 length:1137 start_codon:yes stop_codon:yes gene_type:complete
MKYLSLFLLSIFFFSQPSVSQKMNKTYLFVGCYTEKVPGTGMYVFEFDSGTGSLKEVSKVENIVNASFLTLAPDGKFVYACTETQLETPGNVSAYGFNAANGQLSFLNKQSVEGRNPAYAMVHPAGRFVASANYTDGGVSIFERNNDGSLKPAAQHFDIEGKSVVPGRQDDAHTHAAVFDPAGDFLFVPDLGSDKILAYAFDKSSAQPATFSNELTVTTTPGSGPRHLEFHPNGKFAYCVEELSGTVSSYTYSKGKLTPIGRVSTYTKKFDIYGGADLHTSPDGKFLYVSNRVSEENTIAIFSIDQKSGQLTLVGHETTYGDHPRSFVIDPSGNFLLVANQFGNNIVVFKRDKKTGLLTKTDTEVKVKLPASLKMRTY